MKNIVASIILAIVFVLPFQVLADSDHDPNENTGNSTPVNTNSSLVHFTLDDEQYIDDIPFSTELVSAQMYFGNSYLNPMENNFQLYDEEYINDIPFDTEKIYWACSFNQNCGSIDPESVTLEDENYIDDIPFNTEDYASDSIGCENKENEFSITSFNLDEEEYIETLKKVLSSKKIEEDDEYRLNLKLVKYAVQKGFQASLAWKVIRGEI